MEQTSTAAGCFEGWPVRLLRNPESSCTINGLTLTNATGGLL